MLEITYHDLDTDDVFTVAYTDVDDFLTQYALDDYDIDDDVVIDDVTLDGEEVDFEGAMIDLYNFYHPSLTIAYHDLDGAQVITFDDTDDFVAQYILEDFLLADDVVVDDVIINDESIDFEGTIFDLYNLYAPTLVINYHDADGEYSVGYADIDDFLEQYALDDYELEDDVIIDDVGSSNFHQQF